MNIADYFQEYTCQIENFARIGIFADENIEFDHRTETIGVIRGRIVFSDGSFLAFMEFVDIRMAEPKVTYSYQYQLKDGSQVFRYDNALHRPQLGYRNHKHTNFTIQKSANPSILDVLIEIAARFV